MLPPQSEQSLLSLRVPPAVAPKLREYVTLLAEAAPGLVVGCYLVGSLALEAFDERRSDIDFVALLAHPAAASHLAALQHVHEESERLHPRWPLEGSYLQISDLGHLPPQIAPYPCCSGGKFCTAGVHDLNPVTWWLLKESGIALLGPPPQELPFTIEWAAVTDYMHANLHSYWSQFTRLSPRLARLLTDSGVEWAVLGICRLWHALHCGAISSKQAAGTAVLAQAQPQWRKIVAEGLALRGGEPSGYRCRLQRAGATMQFVRAMIGECKAAASKRQPPRSLG